MGSVTFHGDGREQALLNHILNHPSFSTLQNNPDAIATEIDLWGCHGIPERLLDPQFLMTVGVRTQPVLDVIASTKPKFMLELGGYVGYSAVKFGNAVRAAGGSKYYSVEANAEYAAIAGKMVEVAGLQDFVEIIVAKSDEGLEEVKKRVGEEQIGVLFLDHAEDLYLRDLTRLEGMGLLKKGSVVTADNTCHPQIKEYVMWVHNRGEGQEKKDQKYYSHTVLVSPPNSDMWDGLTVTKYL